MPPPINEVVLLRGEAQKILTATLKQFGGVDNSEISVLDHIQFAQYLRENYNTLDDWANISYEMFGFEFTEKQEAEYKKNESSRETDKTKWRNDLLNNKSKIKYHSVLFSLSVKFKNSKLITIDAKHLIEIEAITNVSVRSLNPEDIEKDYLNNSEINSERHFYPTETNSFNYKNLDASIKRIFDYLIDSEWSFIVPAASRISTTPFMSKIEHEFGIESLNRYIFKFGDNINACLITQEEEKRFGGYFSGTLKFYPTFENCYIVRFEGYVENFGTEVISIPFSVEKETHIAMAQYTLSYGDTIATTNAIMKINQTKGLKPKLLYPFDSDEYIKAYFEYFKINMKQSNHVLVNPPCIYDLEGLIKLITIHKKIKT